MPSVHARVERLDALDVLARLLALRSPDSGGAGAGAGGSSGIGSLSVGGAGFGGLQGPGLGCSPAQAAALAPARSAGLLLCEVLLIAHTRTASEEPRSAAGSRRGRRPSAREGLSSRARAVASNPRQGDCRRVSSTVAKQGCRRRPLGRIRPSLSDRSRVSPPP